MSDSDWVVDRGLLVLRDQINAAAPNRDKSSDGTIGDAAHAARDSDHNPESPPPAGNPDRQVDALDVTHDPAHGADMGVVSEAIRRSKDVRVKYVIFACRIFYPTSRNGYPAWAWQPYSGSDPHTGHMHVSVNDVHHDETQAWEIGIDMALTDAEIQKIAAAAAKLVWASPALEYVDEGNDGKRDTRTTKDILFAAHAAAVESERGTKVLVARDPSAPVPADEELIRRIVREELDKTKLMGA